MTLVVDVERWLSYKGTCHVILLAKLHDMYLYKIDNFLQINHYLKSVCKVALLYRFHCNSNGLNDPKEYKGSVIPKKSKKEDKRRRIVDILLGIR